MADNVALVEQAYDAFGRGDIEAVLGLFSEEIEWNEAENSAFWPGRPFHGPQEIVDGVFARVGQETSDFRIAISRIVGCGATVLVEARYGGTWSANGNAFDLQACHIWDFEGDRAVRLQQYTDTWGWARATGEMAQS